MTFKGKFFSPDVMATIRKVVYYENILNDVGNMIIHKSVMG